MCLADFGLPIDVLTFAVRTRNKDVYRQAYLDIRDVQVDSAPGANI